MSRSEVDSKLLNSIFIGEVASVHNYGAFVRIPGSKNQGLIHRSQVSKVSVDDVSEVLHQGDKVWCKVINITDDNKIGLSMKVVDQGNGKDLDPNGVQIHQDEQKRKAFVPGSRKKTIQLEAVFNTTCTKCGTHGHLARDCFKSPDGKTYELIPDDDPVVNQPTLVEDLKTKKEKKKEKKKKKHKKVKTERKEKKKKKHKKNRRRSSSSERSSSDSSNDGKKESKRSRKQSSSVSVSPQRSHKRKSSVSVSPDRQKKPKQ